MKHLLLSIFLSILCINCSAETTFEQEWKSFLAQKEIDASMIGKEEYLSTELALIEEFGNMQFPRRRNSIKGMDRDERWIPYNENRVTLRNGTEMSASHMRFDAPYHSFIASQAPYKHNISLFWQMIWENQTNQIVQVTELQEPKGELSVPYWPEKKSEALSLDTGLKITMLDERWLLSDLHEKIQIRTFEIQKDGQKRVVTHYWYRNWPDNNPPGQMQTIAVLIDTVQREKVQSGSQAPILVHCHAGVGRTGVFIALYHLTQRSQMGEPSVKFFDLVASLRWQRPRMVGNPKQYAYCYSYLKNL